MMDSSTWLTMLPKANSQTSSIELLPVRQGHGRRHDDVRNEELANLISLIPDGLLCIGPDWHITYANPEARRVLGIEAVNMALESIWKIFPELHGTELERAYRSVMLTGRQANLEYFSPRSDTWFDIRIFPTREGIAAYLRDSTDRKGSDLLRESASRQLMAVLEATTDAVISVNRDYTLTFLNRRARELLAVKGNLMGRNLWQEFPFARDHGQYAHFFERAMRDGIPGEFEEFYPDPLNRWYAFQLRPSEEGVVLFFRDITQRKQNEEALTASEERYRILADLNPQGIWTGAPDGTVTYANQVLFDYTGLTSEDLKHDRWLKCFHPDDQQRILSAWRHSVNTGDVLDLEVRMIRAHDGRSRWWWNRAQPLKDEHANILSWIGVLTDIDDRKTFAEQLQLRQEQTERQRAELETIYRTAPIGLALFDPIEFRYLRVNDRQVETIGIPRDQILGRRITDLIPLPGIAELFSRIAAGDTIRNHIFEGELPARPGDHRFWNCNYSPVRSSDGKVEAIAAVVQEITHEKKAEAALVQSEKLAAVGRLASSISHEINNPLEAITNLLYLIGTTEELPPGIVEYVSTAQSELSRVCQIATQTLRFHRQAVSASDICPCNLVEDVLNLYQGRLINSDIAVEVNFHCTRTVVCFENDIRQVLNNLIANAIDAMRSSGGRLLIRTHNISDQLSNGSGPRDGIRITVADTGHGMSSATRGRIFEPFYTTKELNGTGLGLWISKGIVDRHHGRLTVRSSQHPVHHGTVFSLFLPCLDVGLETDTTPKP